MGAPTLSDEEWLRTRAALEAADWNITKAAEALGEKRKTISARVASARRRGLLGDMTGAYIVKGESTLRDGDGNVKLVWEKTELDKTQLARIAREVIAGLTADLPVYAEKTPAPKAVDHDLCVTLAIGDAHMGLYSWAPETGNDFDCDIAKRDLMAAADRLIEASPSAEECLVLQLGDFFHMDSQANTTAKGTRVDVDTRFAAVVRNGIATMRYVIDQALKKYKKVRVRNVAGNHDPHAVLVLQEALIGFYHAEPRVIIEDSPRAFWTHRFGQVLIGVAHGHAAKPEKMPGLLAVDAQKDWGECRHRYVHHGHFHSKRMFEDLGVIVEGHRCLAGKDAWHSEMGYRSGREMQSIVYHRDFGEIERHVAGIRMIRSA
jgi:predicted phosphodiesterase